jgi:hypothetical protein
MPDTAFGLNSEITASPYYASQRGAKLLRALVAAYSVSLFQNLRPVETAEPTDSSGT